MPGRGRPSQARAEAGCWSGESWSDQHEARLSPSCMTLLLMARPAERGACCTSLSASPLACLSHDRSTPRPVLTAHAHCASSALLVERGRFPESRRALCAIFCASAYSQDTDLRSRAAGRRLMPPRGTGCSRAASRTRSLVLVRALSLAPRAGDALLPVQKASVTRK